MSQVGSFSTPRNVDNLIITPLKFTEDPDRVSARVLHRHCEVRRELQILKSPSSRGRSVLQAQVFRPRRQRVDGRGRRKRGLLQNDMANPRRADTGAAARTALGMAIRPAVRNLEPRTTAETPGLQA
jgi:hypothetical protein